MTIKGTVSTTNVPLGRWVGGPWRGSTGVLYAANSFNLMKSTNGGVTWTVHDQYVGRVYGGGTYRSVWSQQIGDVLHLVVSQGPNNNKLEYQEWNLATGNWIVVHPVGHPLSWEPSTTALGISMAIRSTGEVVLIAPGSTYRVMGTDYQPLVMLRRNPSDGVWGDPVAVAGGSDQANYSGPVAVRDLGDRVHLYYRNHTAGSAATRTLRADNTLSDVATFVTSVAAAQFLHGRSGLLDLDGTLQSIVPYLNNSDIGAVAQAPTVDSPTLSHFIGVSGSSVRLVNNTTVLVGCSDAASQFHFLYARTSDNALMRDVNTGSGWGTDTQVITGDIRNVSAEVYTLANGDKVIGYLVDDGGTLKYGEVLLEVAAAAGYEVGWGVVLI